MKKTLLFCFLLAIFHQSYSQETFPVNGSFDVRPGLIAFTNATIVISADQTINNGTLLVKGQNIEAAGQNITIPKGYLVINLEGKFIYPSLIDAFTSYGLPETPRQSFNFGRREVYTSTKKGAYGWNESIRPEMSAQNIFTVDSKKAEELKKIGFGTVHSVIRDGIARGTSLVSTLSNEKENQVIINKEAAANYSFNKGTAATDYPQSLMGAIALLRQTYYDAGWYKGQKTEHNISIEEFNRQQNLPQIFEIDDMLDVLRADKVGDEFGKQYIFKAGGNEFERIKEIKATGGSFIVPLNFPKAFDVEDAAEARNISLARMKYWELAPSNPSALEKAGIKFALTGLGLEKSGDFWANLRKAIEFGLTEKQALRSLTQIPAEMLGVSDQVGTLNKGKLANFIITSSSLFQKDNIIYENWVQGKRFVANKMDVTDLRGNYAMTLSGVGQLMLKIGGTPGSYDVNIVREGADSVKAKATMVRSGDLLSLYFDLKKSPAGTIRLNGYLDSAKPVALKGDAVFADGNTGLWSASFKEPFKENAKKETPAPVLALGTVIYPFVSFGYSEAPSQETVLFKNATVWTNEKEGKLSNTDVLIEGGKIKAIGKNLNAGKAKVIDASGKHLTAGIIDEHSHIAISSGVNEGTQAVTSEVRIGDVIDSEDINIYRQLAGGVTTSHLLHGSANPIGGQSQLIKLRWGKSPEEMKFGGNDGFIKFALGENVKQSNWGDAARTRFPQTRMGVEQVYVDAFTRAKEYQTARAIKGNNVRRDLELDALVEILNNKRFITCHSYVQSEINMLMHVADSMGFKINTFTHILEGYKVADKMAAKGIAASTFSDWWAYKNEVAEAIPYNGVLMSKVGVLTAFNSDDAEMARRLNQEAGKAVKYGGMSQEDALKLVTLNPAKMMHIDNRVGSIKAGKDADLVLWSDNPLSVYAKAEKTFVDGIAYWDMEKDAGKQKELKAEEARLVAKMLEAKNKGALTQKPGVERVRLYDCETLEGSDTEEIKADALSNY
ncbi:amidohydrolase family protein [Daejeonella oryzae]|uniref:amidohydrolase family protein n=1 Tax=Daejeonella oryzae TaxID=1122943 RepID=UPI0004293AF9|nr:amidohydrolase family protein [Daejeonella oryzae]